ncbi:unnamed protein product [Gongylonema pulchrum]|uniref:RRM domain-containing protein n=1 Tax=Gongylonema pulchrum TaxID=637853 RepID=A0A183DGQ5_9BILA|nr:unnamed protein product [Gongylonema pulchrum]
MDEPRNALIRTLSGGDIVKERSSHAFARSYITGGAKLQISYTSRVCADICQHIGKLHGEIVKLNRGTSYVRDFRVATKRNDWKEV